MTKHQGPYCGARLLKREGTCQLPRGWGTDHPGSGHCRKHLGNTPNGRKAAAEEAVQARAREELVRLGAVVPCTNALRELQRQVGLTLQWRDTCVKLINRLDADDLRYEGNLRGEQLRAEVAMLQDSFDRSGNQLVALAKLNIDERLVVVEERKATMLAAAFAESLAAAGLPPDRAAIARADFVSRLHVLSEEDDGAFTGVVIPPRPREGLT